ncbi:hypothetical protein C8R45DRAFT_817648 [Mycena sanguinolenta]|nr:hypothetical protein C8R45DRAFT_817648 [Mycena sanguinolenta]
MARGNRCHIPAEHKQLFTTMANYLKPKQIATAAHVNVRTVQRVLKLWCTTGKHARIPLELGRPRILTQFDISYLEGLILRTPDIYLCELQQHLFESTGLAVTQNTIRNALLRRRYTRKRISVCLASLPGFSYGVGWSHCM